MSANISWIFLSCNFFVDLAAPKVRIKVETALAADKIESEAFSDGLQPEQLVNLVKLATSGKYGQYSQRISFLL